MNIEEVIGQPEGTKLEYKTVLPPSKNIARIISSFANAKGGHIILGIAEEIDGIKTIGLSSDFHANSITHKAIDLLSPKPKVEFDYVRYENKNLFVIQVDKSDVPISLRGNIYVRSEGTIKLHNPDKVKFKYQGYERIIHINKQLEIYKKKSTGTQFKLIEHYQSILKIMDDLGSILYPINADTPTDNQEGKILTRILFSSIADSFETYLSDLLYEIFLAKPQTLKSQKQVTIKEVLDCSDLEDFVHYWATKQIGKLQKGSVKGFIEENNQIKQLKVIDTETQNEIEKILQIRHLYSHRNGIVDEKFLQFFSGEFSLNSEHTMSISQIIDKLVFVSKISDDIDNGAVKKYHLALR